MTSHRPQSVTILASWHFILGVIAVVLGILSLFYGNALIFAGTAETANPSVEVGSFPLFIGIGVFFSSVVAVLLGPFMIFAGLGAILGGSISLVTGYGLATLKRWGWILAVIFAVLNIINNVIILFQGANISWAISGILVSGLIIYWLLKPGVRRVFNLENSSF